MVERWRHFQVQLLLKVEEKLQLYHWTAVVQTNNFHNISHLFCPTVFHSITSNSLWTHILELPPPSISIALGDRRLSFGGKRKRVKFVSMAIITETSIGFTLNKKLE